MATKQTVETAEQEPASNGRKAGKATPRECQCGCGEITSGGNFRPGHDARMKGQLIRLVEEGGPEGEAALERLRAYPKLVNIRAMEARLGAKVRKREAQAKARAEREAARNAARAANAA